MPTNKKTTKKTNKTQAKKAPPKIEATPKKRKKINNPNSVINQIIPYILGLLSFAFLFFFY